MKKLELKSKLYLIILLLLTVGCSKSKIASEAMEKLAEEEMRQVAKNSTEEVVENAGKKVVKKVGNEELSEQFAKRTVRKEVEKTLKERGIKSYSEYSKKVGDELADKASAPAHKVTESRSIKDVRSKKTSDLNMTVKAGKTVKQVTGKEAITLLKSKGHKGLETIIKSLEPGLPIDDLVVKELDNGALEIAYKTATYGSISSITIKGNKIMAKAGSLPGKNSAQNQFLNNILPNMTYEVDGVFVYKTDALGRVVEASVNKSKLKNTGLKRAGRHSSTQKKVAEQMGYDGGHIFDCGTGGPNEYINQVPMESKFNRNGAWRKMEIQENELTDLGEVIITRKIVYKGDSKVPSKFVNDVRIDGKKYTKDYPSVLINPVPKS